MTKTESKPPRYYLNKSNWTALDREIYSETGVPPEGAGIVALLAVKGGTMHVDTITMYLNPLHRFVSSTAAVCHHMAWHGHQPLREMIYTGDEWVTYHQGIEMGLEPNYITSLALHNDPGLVGYTLACLIK